ncbi:MAG: hypothetical protein WC054_00670 [Candidatus Nanopelagicales bacterium]
MEDFALDLTEEEMDEVTEWAIGRYRMGEIAAANGGVLSLEILYRYMLREEAERMVYAMRKLARAKRGKIGGL